MRESFSLVSVVSCQENVSASSWSLVQRSFTVCGVSEYKCEFSIMRSPWLWGIMGHGKIKQTKLGKQNLLRRRYELIWLLYSFPNLYYISGKTCFVAWILSIVTQKIPPFNEILIFITFITWSESYWGAFNLWFMLSS